MNKKTVLTFILTAVMAFTAYAQQYDSESDFRIDWDKEVKGGAIIAEYLGSKKEIRIPPRIQNLPVTGIAAEVFRYKSLTGIIIPESVTRIEEGAFSRCSSLASVTIGDGVTVIGKSAFSDCTSLTGITIPDNVKSIGDQAFSNCSRLASVTIGNGITGIGDNVFSRCSSLAKVTMPNSVTYIGKNAFSGCTNLTSVTIPNSVTNIGENAFSQTGLTGINIPDGVTSIGNSAFSSCTNLAGVTIGKSVTGIGENAFSNCSRLTGVIIPENVYSISNSAFSGCTSLASVTIGNNVFAIGGSAFSGCTGLTSVTLPDNVTYIGKNAFSGCTNLTSVTFLSMITSGEFNNLENLGDLRDKYLASDGGIGTYTRFAKGEIWMKQQQAASQPTATRQPTNRTTSTPSGFVRIQGGTFMMGSPANEPGRGSKEVQHQVTVSGFYMGKYEVTQKEYQEVMGTNPSNFKGDNLPVENVSWYDAIEYCNRRSVKEGLTPAYFIDDRNYVWNRNANGYRLPTEAEWEYACRAGTTTAYNTGANISDNTGWYDANSGGKTHPVGQKPANAWGLFDMHGNVNEWCWDWYGDYSSGAQTDPVGAVTGSDRVGRGGAWNNYGRDLRSAYRYDIVPYDRFNGVVGFRLVRP